MRHRWGMCFSFVMIINVKKYAYGIVMTCHSDQTCVNHSLSVIEICVYYMYASKQNTCGYNIIAYI